MGAPDSAAIRNIVLVGQDGAGKTSLAEAMLFRTGKTKRLGTTADGKSNLDYDSEEIKRQYTIATSLAPIAYKGNKVNLLDTPGNSDFYGDTIAAMLVSEMALFMIDATSGVQVATRKLWKRAVEFNTARAFFVNMLDKENTDFDETLSALQDEFGSRVGAVALPIGSAGDYKGVVDVIRMKAYLVADGKESIGDVPAEMQDAAQAAHEALFDLVAEADDEIMMKYLEGEEITQDELETLLGKAIAEGLFVPVFAGAGLKCSGVDLLLDDAIAFFPNPTAHAPLALAGEEAGETLIDPAAEPAAFVFKTMTDNFVGRISFVKVLGGTLEPGMDLVNSRTGKKDRMGHLNSMCGSETSDIDAAVAGDIIVIPKLNEAKTGDTLSKSGKLELAPIPFPTPIYPVAVEAQDKKSEDKLSDFLNKATESDPTITLRRDEETHQSLLTGLGETQINVVLARLKESTGIEVNLPPVRVPYRESIRKTAEAQGRHKKQTGGAGQFGDCYLRVEPNPGGGYEFVDEVVGGRIPRNFIPAVDKGVQEMLEQGVLAGYPMVDIKVAVYDGSYHSVDSNEMAFKTAAHIGFKAACEKASLYLLEPMANLTVTTDEEYAGAIMSDIPTRRGRIMGMDHTSDGDSVIRARVPYAEVVQYAKQLRSLTRGSGEYTIEIDGYEEVPREAAQKIIDAYEAAKEK
ncbi:MAG: elongation factor G [Actinomycetota bacterium]|nr:elongation factor G [Actinomycetota bacterium]